MLFVYRELNRHRDCCCYFPDDVQIGSNTIIGPCFSYTFGSASLGRNHDGFLDYDEIETYLTRDEYEEVLQNGVSEKTIEALTSPAALNFAEEIREDERYAIMDEFRFDETDLNLIFDSYTDDYWDRGIIGSIFDSWTELAENEAWELGYVDGGLEDRYFDYDAFADDLKDNDESLVELDDGRVVRLNY